MAMSATLEIATLVATILPKRQTPRKKFCANVCLANSECCRFTWWSGDRFAIRRSGVTNDGTTELIHDTRCGFIPSRTTVDLNALKATVDGLVTSNAQHRAQLMRTNYLYWIRLNVIK